MSLLRHPGLLLAGVLIALLDPAADAKSLAITSAAQYLPPIPGYIPVFIRQGDTPLEDINADLAEAFRAYAAKHASFNAISGRSKNVLEGSLQKEARRTPPSSTPDASDAQEGTSNYIQKISAKKAKQS